MTQKIILSWKQIVEKYPDEWVLLEEYEPDYEFDKTGVIARKGIVVLHSKDKKDFYERAKKNQSKKVSVSYTGDLVPEGYRGIWQFTNSSSDI